MIYYEETCIVISLRIFILLSSSSPDVSILHLQSPKCLLNVRYTKKNQLSTQFLAMCHVEAL